MASESQASGWNSAVDDVKGRLDRLEDELEEEIEEGRGRIVELVSDIETRLEGLRPEEEPEEPTSRVETIRGRVDELVAEVESEVTERREIASSTIEDLRERLDDLERAIQNR